MLFFRSTSDTNIWKAALQSHVTVIYKFKKSSLGENCMTNLISPLPPPEILIPGAFKTESGTSLPSACPTGRVTGIRGEDQRVSHSTYRRHRCRRGGGGQLTGHHRESTPLTQLCVWVLQSRPQISGAVLLCVSHPAPARQPTVSLMNINLKPQGELSKKTKKETF